MLFQRCHDLMARVQKLDKILVKVQSENEKLKLETGMTGANDDEDEARLMDDTFRVNSHGKVVNMGDSLYDHPDISGKYIGRIEPGTMIKLASVKIAPNAHGDGLMIQIRYGSVKAWMSLQNTSFVNSLF